MQGLLQVSRAIDRVTRLIGKVIEVLVVLLILMGVYNVITRYVGQLIRRPLSSNAAQDSMSYGFSLIFFLGFAYILLRNENVRVDFLYANWSDRRRALVNFIGNMLFLIPFCVLGLYVTLPSVRTSWSQNEYFPQLGSLPIYPLKTMILVAFGLLLLQAISETIKHLAALQGVNDPIIHAAEQSVSLDPIE